jgi:voltage-gated potassium channel Kch
MTADFASALFSALPAGLKREVYLMIGQLLYAAALLAICVFIHAMTLSLVIKRVARSPALANPNTWSTTWVLVRIAWWVVLAHLLEAIVWALFYVWRSALPDLSSAGYFSIVTYTTVGYGDLLPPEQWRLAAGVEALTGILMCGWSAAFIFAVVSRMHDAWMKTSAKPP